MNLFTFFANFTSKNSYREHFKLERDKLGLVCTGCENTTHYWIKSVWSYECKKCTRRTSLLTGTIMQSSNLLYMVCYKTMFLLSVTKKGFSSKNFEKVTQS